MKMKASAILLAGGKGIRMGESIPKQFLPLAGQAVILHSLEKFETCEFVSEIILVLPESKTDFFHNEILKDRKFKKLKKETIGGLTRQDSTQAGFLCVDSAHPVVLVHDVARPLVSVKTIEECVKTAFEEGAALAACAASDTIKECDERGRVLSTHAREKIFLAQTPQAARYEILKEALSNAYKNSFQGTDEASLIEKIGKTVKVVMSDSSNIKLTRPSDFVFAEAILKEMK